MWKLNIKLNAKILLLIESTIVIIFAIAIGYISLSSKKMALEDAKKITNSHARENANLIKADLEKDMGIARALSYSFLSYENIPREQRKEIYSNILKNTFIENPIFLAVWASFELETYGEETYDKTYGRERFEIYSSNNKIVVSKEKLNMSGDDVKSIYYNIKIKKQEVLTDPYWYSYTKQNDDRILEASICAPILEGEKFIGLTGVDVPLNRFQILTDKISPFENSFAFLVSYDGSFVAHPDKKIIGKKIPRIYPELEREFNLTEKIKEGKAFSFISNQLVKNQDDFYYSFAPIKIGNSDTPWTLAIAVSMDNILEKPNENFYISILVGFIGLLVLFIIIWFISLYITKPLNRTAKIVKKLAKGDIKDVKKMKVLSKDEIGEIRHSVNILISGLKSTAKFANQIGKGNLNYDFKLLSKKDVLGNALLNMRASLKKAKDEEENRQTEDNKRNWATHGVAKFSEIMRHHNSNMTDLSYQIISNLVKYLEANQGGLFVINNEYDNPNKNFIELASSFAYGRKKFVVKRIEIGEGLVGRSVQEKETIYMTQIPEGYIEITSGLGKNIPSSLLIVPLKINEEVLGVIEVASFSELENYQIEFVEKIAESIASTISTVKINIRTSELLEATRKQSEVLAAQEEEMRQNLEELQTTQEESARKEQEMRGRIDAINRSFILLELDMKGNILQANNLFLKLLGYSKYEIIGKSYSMFLSQEYAQSEEYGRLLSKLLNGESIIGEFEIEDKMGNPIYLRGSFNPISDINGKLYKIIQLATDATNEVKLSNKIAKKK